MPLPQLRVRSVLPFALVAGLAVGAIGCGGGESVQTYAAPKSEGGKAPGAVEAATEYRILGAMYPAKDPEWFFKMSGPADQLAKYEADFDKLLASVSLPANGPPKFDAPEGWKTGPGRAGIVVATIRTPDDKFEVTVTSSIGGVEANLRRWAVQQLGAKDFGPEDVAKVTKPIDAKGVKGLRADVRGPNNPSPKGGPFMGGGK
ncbi:hypothetical protein J8F10_31515 [Gemmata sp. G18]|uniref:Uncharacterized protein n=1 Tax=Gemmata palustris TaxID=2822762 RepID=A0ABS5C1D2_9BACT|nr:hypothetical protein [Gemmata palustris]MBP3959799.1 hypothetical protein [Gemmata palustris]